jgi:hypothetical protein
MVEQQAEGHYRQDDCQNQDCAGCSLMTDQPSFEGLQLPIRLI